MGKKIKTACDKCVNRKGCNTLDRSRETACKDFKKEKKKNVLYT